MKIHYVVQKSQEWADLRRGYRTASEASAMMGASNKTTRSELLRMKATGHEREFSSWVQKNLLDKGNEIEANARKIAEEMLGEELFPISATDDEDYLFASFDGVTEESKTPWECKLWNESKAAIVRRGLVPDEDYWQVVQQLVISKSEHLLYMVTDGTTEKTVSVWKKLLPDDEKRLRAGWNQFDSDRENYQHQEVIPAAVATPQMALPAIIITASGSLSIETNFAKWEVELRAFIKRIPENPSTDQEFEDCKAALAAFKKAETELDAEETRVLSLVPSVDDMRRHKNLLRDLSSTARLALEKLVVRRDIDVKNEIMSVGRIKHEEYIKNLNEHLGGQYVPYPVADPRWGIAIKNKRSYNAMRDAVSDALAKAKIEADETADRIAINQRTLEAHDEHKFMFPDLAQVILKANDDFEALVKSRISAHKEAEAERIAEQEAEAAKKLEAERVKIRAEEEAKARAEVASSEALRVEELRQSEADAHEQIRVDEAAKANIRAFLSSPLPEIIQPKITPQEAVVDAGPVIRAFLASREWARGDDLKARAILVEYEKFRAARDVKVAA